MQPHTLVLDLNDDGSVSLASATLGGVRVAIRRGGAAERVTAVRPVLEDEIEHYVRGFEDCARMGAWHLLDAAREVVAEAENAASATSAELARRLHVPIARRVPDLAALLVDVNDLAPLFANARRLHEVSLQALEEFEVAYREAASVHGAADGGDHQRPLIEEGDNHVRH